MERKKTVGSAIQGRFCWVDRVTLTRELFVPLRADQYRCSPKTAERKHTVRRIDIMESLMDMATLYSSNANTYTLLIA